MSQAPQPPQLDLAQPDPYPAEAQSNGMAVASLVCGIFGCIFPCAVLAIVFGILGLNRTKNPRVGGKGMCITGIILGAIFPILGILALLISILLPSLNHARETANRAKCARNLNQIGQGLLLYSNADPNQAYPPDLGTLYLNEDLTTAIFLCPDSTTPGYSGPKDQQAAQWINQNSSYIYLGKSMNPNSPPSMVLAYELLVDHGRAGMNVLFADGHVQWIIAPTATAMEKQLKLGQNPSPALP